MPDGNHMIDGEILGVVGHLAVGAKAILRSAFDRQFFSRDIATVFFYTGTSAVASSTMNIRISSPCASLGCARFLNIGSI